MHTKIKLTLALSITVISILTGYADTFTIGDKQIVVPAPKGFVPITEEMTAVSRYVQQMVDPMNDTLAYYISESDIPIAMAGEIPPLEHTFILKVNKELRKVMVGTKDFTKLKQTVKEQNEKIFDKVRSQISENMKQMSEGVSQEFDIKFAMTVSQVVPLDPHYEEENAMAYSMYLNYGVTAEDEDESGIVSATSTFLNASGIVLFLYSYGPKDDLEWTRSASNNWATSVMTSNARPPRRSSGGRGIDWNQVIEKGIVGGITGGLIALLASGLSRFRKKKES